VLYYQAGNYEKAITAAGEALKRRPDYADAYNNMAAAYRGLERWDSAAGAANQALRIQPGFRAARQNLILSKERKR
jgi:tetratricopeptide (TPR) repeat protein